MNEKKVEQLNKVWKDFENAKTYQNTIGIRSMIPKCVKYFEGDQWPDYDDDTKYMPRPVFNICKMNVNNKIANVGGTPIKLNYVADNDSEASNKFTRFAAYQQKEMRMEEANDRALEDGAVKGTYCYHFYWNEKKPGKRGNYEGGLEVEIIEPLNVYFANPREHDIEKQKWVMFECRVEVDYVKQIADEGIDKSLISKDELESDYHEQEQDGSDLCTLLLRYFKKDGEVYFERAVKNTIVNKPVPLNPLLNEENESIEEDTSNAAQPDSTLVAQEERDIDDYKFNMYPVTIGSWDRRNNSIYGIGEVETLIPNQNAVNFEFGMQLLNHQEDGWSKILAKPNALDGQEITNTPGEIIIDYTPGANNFWGIKRLENNSMSGSALALAPQIVDLTRTVTNSTEVITGEMLSKDISGISIGLLQEQSLKPIARLQKNFWKAQERNGKILELFYKFYYEDKEYTYDISPEEAREINEYNQKNNMPLISENTKITSEFNGEDFLDTKFEVIVEAGAGTQYSEVQGVSLLNGFLQAQMIDLKTFAKLCPDKVMPFKNELIAIEEQKEQSELMQLRQAVQQQGTQIEELVKYTQNQDKVIKQYDGELKKTNKLFMDLQKESATKITALNDYIMSKEQPKQKPKDNKATA